MNNDEYKKMLESQLLSLKELRYHAKELAAQIIGVTLFKEDLFFTSSLDKSIALSDGIVKMLNTRNLTCVGILVRTQIDICLRIFAAFIAADRNTFINGFIKGEPIKSFKDNLGKSMTDKQLRKRLELYDPRVSDVYVKASGYIHFSDMALYSSVNTKSDFQIEFSVGLPIREEANEILLEGADAFIHFQQLLFQLLQPVVDSKKRVDGTPF